jgi:uncharacterized protein (TIGR00369 family)
VTVRLLPYADFLGIRIVGERNGAPLLVMPYSEGLTGQPGMLHGGAVAGLLEIAAIAAMDATLDGDEDARTIFKPITVTVDFMRPGLRTDAQARATVERLGTRIANVSARAWQGDPTRPIATARMNIAIAPRQAKEL